ncbi:MAG: hypothetical protein A2508_01330 [Candidatus Lambdaproteobacteria bacterium RIFOXYD12_FULL_49_8]|uniref:Uncharacterized protein n=1 Tax=Candidatus Lambdaproteobacteria bacterium RIFOXYD2_FULL_50_16 TaxID=1817772 RepID=A0A1F6GFN2_9PROT|nr:MAG: hypothetical protein A3K03_08265 [Bdellovibrionales bacterium RIFOXYD1_FULL_44_7]OGG96902.1 MAG: hypothetical protein A2527_00025 [Candidatus Lambdaproteobacteria bacterium RIFOXYD2_FULL_50_16]OGG97499.1 MAG: hypothetical protein A2508_01330 [Candidatus Lambdaproteobacteria bacterium RIFOXYD12_FULL_49_8]
MGFLGLSSAGPLKYSTILKLCLDQGGKLKRLRALPIELSPKLVPHFDSPGRSLKLDQQGNWKSPL